MSESDQMLAELFGTGAAADPQPPSAPNPILLDYEQEWLDAIEEFEDKAWSPSAGGLKSGWKELDEALEGFQTGWILVGGSSNVGKCLTWDSLIVDVQTGELKTIEEIFHTRSATLLTLNENLKLAPIQPEAFVDDGVKPVFRIKTRLGREIKTTASHPFLTINGWKKLMDLQVGQHIAVPRIIPVFGSYDAPESEVKLLGYLLSDGCTIGKVALTNDNPLVVEDFINAVHEFDPNLKVSIYDSQGTRCPTWQVHTQFDASEAHGKHTLMQKVREWGIDKKATEKEFPGWVFTLTKPKLALLLSRMFDCDGTVYEVAYGDTQDKLTIAYSSASKKLIMQMQHLLLRFGIIAQVREKWTTCNGSRHQSWELEIRDSENLIRFIEEIGFNAKQDKARKIYEKAKQRRKAGANRDIIPADVWNKVREIKEASGIPWAEVGKKLGLAKPKRAYNYVNLRRNVQRETLLAFAKGLKSQALMDLATSDIYWDEIVSIEYVGEEQVYDLTIPGTHNFVANDICVHNTSWVSALGWRLAENNPDDCFVLDISLDDPMSHKLPRVVATANKVLINAVRNPNAYIQFPQMLQRRAEGIEKLKKAKDRYRALDSTYVEPVTKRPLADIDAIEELVKRYKVALLEEAKIKGLSQPRKLVVIIDNFYDLQTTAKEAMTSENARYEYLAERIDKLCTNYDICCITTGEFRKLNGFRRPQVDDLRQTIKVVYKAKAILLVHNDVSLRGEAATIYFERQGSSAKQPILEVKFGKNKFTSFKGTLFFEFYPELAYFEPVPPEDAKKYLNLIYSD